MEVTDHVDAGTIVLTLTGKMDFHARQSFHQAIKKATAAHPRQVLLNFSQVPFIDSAGLGLLMLAHKSLQEANIQLALETPEGYVKEVLTLTNIGAKIPIAVIDAPAPVAPAALAQVVATSTIPLKPPLVFESHAMQELLLPILEKLEGKVFDLPPFSEIASKVLALTNDPDASADTLVNLIQQDPILTARVFRTANSAGCGASHAIESLGQAIAWLGLNSVAGLALALSVQSGIFNDRGYKPEVRALWKHAIATGLYAKSLAGMIRKNQDTAFLCGMLHSLGKLFVVHIVNEWRPSSAASLPWSAMVTLMEQSYVEVGRQLADAWNFPAPVKEAINLHQHYSYHLATDLSKGAALTCLGRHVATYHVDAMAMPKDMLLALPVATALQIPPNAIDDILKIKPLIQAQIESLLI